MAVAGHARLSARLLKYGGGGVKTGAGSRDPCDECDECDRIQLFSLTKLEVCGDSGPREDQRGGSVAFGLWQLSAGGRAGGWPGALRGASRSRNAHSLLGGVRP